VTCEPFHHTDRSHSTAEGKFCCRRGRGSTLPCARRSSGTNPPIHWAARDVAAAPRGETGAHGVRPLWGLGPPSAPWYLSDSQHPTQTLATSTWIAEVTLDETDARKSGWYKPAQLSPTLRIIFDG